MADVALRLDIAKTLRSLSALRDRAPVAVARALNRAAGSTRTMMVRHVAADVGIKASDVRKVMHLQEARPSQGDKMVARLSISGKRIPLIAFGARGPEPSRGRGRGVSARLKGGRNRYPHAFIATMRSGHRGVFQRVTGARRHGLPPHRGQLPIHELKGPSLPKVFEKYVADGLKRGEAALLTNLRHEMRFAWRQLAAA